MATKKASKSDAVRKVLAKKPSATVKEIESTLKEEGVKASTALISKVKYGSRRAKKNGRARKGISKADAIRQTWKKLGARARPRDVGESLAKEGMRVSSAQVSTLRRSNGKPHKATEGSVVTLEHLLAAKHLVKELGSIEAARQTLNDLAKLVQS